LKLLNFSGRSWLVEELRQLWASKHGIDEEDDEMDKWNDPFHEDEVGDLKNAVCKSCFVVGYLQPNPFSFHLHYTA
jgi:hypothetical protein